ncbi:MAG: ligD [Chitinophagaceae bacterium]|nr:ligD [Chitinophagaceae bacterium]
MLAKETTEPFDDKDWLYEIKWDGYRAIAEVNNGDVRLYSRNGNTFENSYPVVVNELKKIKADAVLDGEIVVLNNEGVPEFQLLQHYEENTHRPIQFYAFDILSLNGHTTTELPLIERKKLLQKIIPKNEVIKYSDHIMEKGIDFFNVSKEKNLEGILAKKADSHYYIGKRTNEWLKIKNHKTQEAIICGYTDPGGARKYFGALVLGVKDGDKLKYIGHTGSGFTQKSLKEMWDLLQPLRQSKSPFAEKIKTNMPVTWVKPKLVCEMKFTEITREGILRHPIFLHLREDKSIKEVTMANTKTVKKAEIKKIDKGEKKLEDPENENDKIYSFEKIKVKVTNINKLYFPDEGITKGDVVNYYQQMADYILPYLKGRPQSLLRMPNGINTKGFFHKDAGAGTPSFVKTKKLFSESTNKDINYIICDNKPTLAYLNNLGSIEINPWHSTIEKLDYPDYLMIDIDPSNENTFEQVIEAANVVKEVLDRAGAPSYCKTSGASGLHVYVPTAKKYTYEQVKDFAYLICMLASEQIPAFTTLERNLQKRGHKHIYMDYLQNRRGQTIACVYSLRPKPGATVSAPLLWKEVKSGLTPQDFTINNIMKRVKKMGDIFTPILGKGIDLNKCLKKLGG